MENKNLSQRLRALGFPMLEPTDSQEANLTLAEVIKSKDTRLWEGFPVILANSLEDDLFNYDKIKGYLKTPTEKKHFGLLIVMSLALYNTLRLKFSWMNMLKSLLSTQEQSKIEEFSANLKKAKDIPISKQIMSSQRLKTTFNNYFKQAQSKLSHLISMKEELSLEYALSQIFSAKQKEIFLKKLKSEKLTKTEKEYFSRTIKKKVLALANSELHRLAQKVLE